MSSAKAPPRLVDRQHARNCLLLNLLVLPGLGSLMARRRSGWLQIALAVVGFGLTGFWFVSFVLSWVRSRGLPLEGGPHLGLGFLGLALFAFGWTWALLTGLSIGRAAGSVRSG